MTWRPRSIGSIARADSRLKLSPEISTLDRLELKLNFLLRQHNKSTGTGSTTSVGTARAASAQTTTTTAEDSPSRVSAPTQAAAAQEAATAAEDAPNVATTTSAPTRPARAASTSISSARAADAAAASSASAARSDFQARGGEGSGTRIRELEVQLKQARLTSDMAQKLHKSANISLAEFQIARGKVDLTLAALQGMDDDFADELDRLKLVIKKKSAELDQAQRSAGCRDERRGT